jgi:hypothetical protein
MPFRCTKFTKRFTQSRIRCGLCLAMITDREAYPDWILPELPNRLDRIPYDEDDDD